MTLRNKQEDEKDAEDECEVKQRGLGKDLNGALRCEGKLERDERKPGAPGDGKAAQTYSDGRVKACEEVAHVVTCENGCRCDECDEAESDDFLSGPIVKTLRSPDCKPS